MISEIDEAEKLHKQGDYLGAAEIYQSILETDSENISAWFNLGVVCRAMEEWEAAKNCFTEALNLDNSHAAAANNLSASLLEEGDVESACKLLEDTLALNDCDSLLIANLCHLYELLGKLTESERLGERAVALDQNSSIALNNLGVVQLRLRKFKEAEANFRAALVLTPDTTEIVNNLATALQRQRSFQESYDLFSSVLHSDPEARLAKLGAAWSLLQLDEAEKSIELSKEIIADLTSEEAQREHFVSSNSSNGMQKEIAKEALEAFAELMKGCQVDYFLVFGTLLGCIREQNFIGNDTDIDIGVWADADLSSLARNLEKYEFSIDYQDKEEDRSYERLSADNFTVFFRNRIAIDIYRHHLIEDSVLCGFPVGSKQLLYKVSQFTLSTVEFLGNEYLAPQDYEKYLRECYGEWMVPHSTFETSIHSPNLVDGDAMHVKGLAYYRTAQAGIEGRFEKMQNLYHLLQ